MGGHEPLTQALSVKIYVKTKELGPIGGRVPENLVCRSANVGLLSLYQNIKTLNTCGMWELIIYKDVGPN